MDSGEERRAIPSSHFQWMGNSKRNLLPEHAKWLKQATRGLASGSADRVCAGKQRYDSALAAAISQRADPIAAESIAIAVVGDADTANFRYRRALLTAMEASILRQGARERAVASASCVLASALLVNRLGSSRTAGSRCGLGSEATR